MWLEGNLEGQPALIHYDLDGFNFTVTHINIGYISFSWDELNQLQQEHVLTQLKSKFPTAEENY